jgi:hypothetical protein
MFVGLCATCQYVRVIKSAKGGLFVMCDLSKNDPHFTKYPLLPVLQCAGFLPRTEMPPSQSPDTPLPVDADQQEPLD